MGFPEPGKLTTPHGRRDAAAAFDGTVDRARTKMKTPLLAAVCFAAVISSLPAIADDAGGKTGLFNTRYCEILTLDREGLKVDATVYNTIGFNDCPTDAWNGITEKDTARQLGVGRVELNGPRYWVLDGIKGSGISTTGKTITVNGIEMGERATLVASILQALGEHKLYKPTEIKRDTVFTYSAGKPVFELTDPDGNIYRMQSYAQILDKDETLDDLAGLGAKLKLPKGWTYATRVLDQDEQLVATGVAYVLQDDFLNSYQRK